MTTFINGDENMHWKITRLHWQPRVAGLACAMNQSSDEHFFSATVDEEYVHFNLPPEGARGSMTVTFPLQLPEVPDWETVSQFDHVESCFNDADVYPPL